MKRFAVIISEPSDAQTLFLSALDAVSVNYQKFSSKELSQLHVENFDALIFPNRILGTVEMAEFIKAFHLASKPIGAFGLSVIFVSQILGHLGITVGVKADTDLISDVSQTGAYPEVCGGDDFITDREHKIISASGEIAGVRRALGELIDMA